MKTISTIALLAVASLLLIPNAQADDKTRAFIGGLIGGVILNEVLDDSNVHTSVSVGYHNRRGHYEWVSVKTWVPGYYERRCDRYGRSYKVWVPGYHTYTKQKVWVEGRGHRHYDRYDRRHHRHDSYYHRDRSHHRDHRRDDRRDHRRHQNVRHF